MAAIPKPNCSLIRWEISMERQPAVAMTSLCNMGCGVIFKLAPDLTETVLHSFPPAKRRDGENPEGALIENHKGDLLGTTYDGGPYYEGVVFKVEPDGCRTCRPLAGARAWIPVGRLLMDKQGDLYGTAQGGGTDGAGIIFKVQKN